jgi:hypothetical protein
MSKTSNPQFTTDQDDDMLPEYDFSQAVRGRHRPTGSILPGVQFLTNTQGQKTAVLLNLQIHNELWQQVLAQHPNHDDFQFLIAPNQQAVYLNFKEHLAIWQILYDRIIAQQPEYGGDRTNK